MYLDGCTAYSTGVILVPLYGIIFLYSISLIQNTYQISRTSLRKKTSNVSQSYNIQHGMTFSPVVQCYTICAMFAIITVFQYSHHHPQHNILFYYSHSYHNHFNCYQYYYFEYFHLHPQPKSGMLTDVTFFFTGVPIFRYQLLYKTLLPSVFGYSSLISLTSLSLALVESSAVCQTLLLPWVHILPRCQLQVKAHRNEDFNALTGVPEIDCKQTTWRSL